MQGKRKGNFRSRKEKGQSIVEFSMVIVLLLLLVFGIIDFSRLFFAYATMSNGVREGARFGVVNPGADAAIIQAAEAMMLIIGGEATITVDYPDEVLDPSTNKLTNFCSHLCRIVVEARSDFDVWTPVLPSFEIVTQATMHIE